MRRSRTLLRLAVGTMLMTAQLAPGAGRARGATDDLMRVVTPLPGRAVPAHPFVNVVVGLGGNGATVHPRTFRARLGRANVTPLFLPVVEDGAIVGMRATLDPALLLGGGRTNHLRLEVRGRRAGRGAVRDVDHVGFRAFAATDLPPRAQALVDSDVITPGVPLQFDATQSDDPELDFLTYNWDFGDGTTSTDPRPQHAFASDATTTVSLTVSDGQLEDSDRVTLLGVPPLDPGRTAGVLRIATDGALEFGAVPPGTAATRSITVQNLDVTPTSQLKIALAACTYGWPTGECRPDGPFGAPSSTLVLGPAESASIDVGFAPATIGHQAGDVTLAVAASNARVVHLLAHGYGGAAPGGSPGPLPIAEPVFFSSSAAPLEESLPAGQRIVLDLTVGACVASGDACVAPTDCASGACTGTTALDPVDVTRDGAGGIYLLADGSYTDPDPNDPLDLSGTLVHLALDAGGNRLGAAVLARTSSFTTQIAADAIPPAAGGQLYVAQYQPVTAGRRCMRSGLEQLVAIRKSDGTQTVLIPRIDTVEGLGACADDYDPVADLAVARDGSAVFAALLGGIYRLRPTPLVMTSDPAAQAFAVHPDGSLVVVTAEDQGSRGLVHVYKLAPDQAATGAPLLSDLRPCATVSIPNDAGSGKAPATFVTAVAVDPVAPGASDGTIVVGVTTGGGMGVVPAGLAPQATFAIASPAGADTCSVAGIVAVDALGQLVF